MNLIIDIGNTRAKIGVLEKNTILKKVTSNNKSINRNVKKLQKEYILKNCIISSVSKYDTNILTNFDKIFELSHRTKIPFTNKYDTPSTLGVDRIALASASVTQYPNQNVLVIDAGTCITYDFINSKNEYLGGAISPGIIIRYKALHKFTTNLPHLQQNDFKLIGKDT